MYLVFVRFLRLRSLMFRISQLLFCWVAVMWNFLAEARTAVWLQLWVMVICLERFISPRSRLPLPRLWVRWSIWDQPHRDDFFILINGVHISFKAILIIPIFAELLLIASGLAFFWAHCSWTSVIWALFGKSFCKLLLATPIITYSCGHHIGPQAARFILLNPMAQIIQDARYVLMRPRIQYGMAIVQYVIGRFDSGRSVRCHFYRWTGVFRVSF